MAMKSRTGRGQQKGKAQRQQRGKTQRQRGGKAQWQRGGKAQRQQGKVTGKGGLKNGKSQLKVRPAANPQGGGGQAASSNAGLKRNRTQPHGSARAAAAGGALEDRVLPVVVDIGPQLAADLVAKHNGERQRLQRRDIAWDVDMARTARERIDRLLYSTCSSKEDPRVPDMGLLTAVAEKSYLVNTFVEMGFHPPKQFALDAVDSWLQGKKDFQGFKKTCYTFGCAAYANINTGMVERMGCSTVRAASVSQGCSYEYCCAAGSHAFCFIASLHSALGLNPCACAFPLFLPSLSLLAGLLSQRCATDGHRHGVPLQPPRPLL